ncbi:MAG: DUF2817 domain-containing protein [Chloroflexi bacterium]|nr:DUF2817 domain-containing protein [Chloroflexota bacterium]
MNLSFPATLNEVWAHIPSWLSLLRHAWPDAQLHEIALPFEDLPWRWIEAPATKHATQALILTAGLHGIEGHVGVAVLDLLLRAHLPGHLAATTDLYIVPLVNPWGMAHSRRVNAHNVDLNRNVWPPETPIQIENPAYDRLRAFLNPKGPVKPQDRWQFFVRTARALIQTRGTAALRSASLQGQSRYPRGVFFAGQRVEPEIRALQHLLTRAMQRPRVFHIDIHTGYGPRDQLTLVAPQNEPRSLDELRQIYRYPHVDRVASETFYAIQGDLGSYVITLGQKVGTAAQTIALEFGTWGDGLVAQMRSLRAVVLENQLYHFGASRPETATWVRDEFRELFFPQRPEWVRRATEQAHAALRGVVHALT